MQWMFLQCRTAASMKVSQSAVPDPVIQIAPALVRTSEHKKEAAPRNRAVPPRVLLRLKSGRPT